MASVNLGEHFDKFVRDQIVLGRYQNASEVVRAGLRLLEKYELDLRTRTAELTVEIDRAWDDTRPSLPATEVFDRLEALHREASRSKPVR